MKFEKDFKWNLKRLHIYLRFSWLNGINGHPGFSSQVLHFLEDKASGEGSWKYKDCCLVLDGMKIKSLMQYDPSMKKMTGFVDFGNSMSESEDLATEALVFMIVALRSKWKQVIAYFLIRSITAEVQAELVRYRHQRPRFMPWRSADQSGNTQKTRLLPRLSGP